MSTIKRFEAENFKRLKVVEITPDGAVIELRGKNAQGKSSVLDAIESAFSYASSKKRTPEPVREGEVGARVTITLSNGLKVTRTYKPGGKSSLFVENAEGLQYKSPQSVLDALYSGMTFDPLSFIRSAPKDQRDILLSVVDLPIDLDEHQMRRDTAFAKRTEVNRDVEAQKGFLDTLPEVPADTPDEEESAAELVALLRSKEEVARQRQDHEGRVEQYEREIARLQKELKDSKAWLKKNPPEDLGPLENRLAAVEVTNAQVRDKRRRAEAEYRLKVLQGDSEAYTSQIKRLDEEKAEALAAADMPVEGLDFDETGVTYQGQPLAQASHAESLKVATAIAMSKDTDLKILRIENGEALDSDSLALMHEMAEENGYQIWLEVVSEDASVGVIIEDGMVVGNE